MIDYFLKSAYKIEVSLKFDNNSTLHADKCAVAISSHYRDCHQGAGAEYPTQ
jgi:hypothetical protein